MNKVTFPLKLRMKRPEVGNLQATLQQLLDRDAILANDEGARKELSVELKKEKAEQVYGKATCKLVTIFQEERKLQVSGVVDEPTANALNAFLRVWDLLPPPVSTCRAVPDLKRLKIPTNELNELKSKSIGELQVALQKLKLNIRISELARKELGPTTTDAIKAFQERAGLAPLGKLTPETVERINAELEHSFVADSKTRIRRLQEMLQRTGIPIDADEVRNGTFGQSTVGALMRYQAQANLPQDGKVTGELINRLREDDLKARLSSKKQVMQLHRILLRALNVAKLSEVKVEAEDLKSQQIGRSTKAAIKSVQKKYGLPETGEIDVATHDRLVSIATSIPQPIKQLKPKAANELRPIKRVARLNMTNKHIGDVQNALAFLGYQIGEKEFNDKTFGKVTRAAVIKYQRDHSLPVTGHVDGETLKKLNRDVQQANPQAITTEHSYRVRGSVRDKVWKGIPSLTVQVWENLITGQGTLLAERKTTHKGFFDIPYDPPLNPTNKQIKQSYFLLVKVLNNSQQEIESKLLFNPPKIAWANFTQGDEPYRGTSEFDMRSRAVSNVINVSEGAVQISIADLVETEMQPQISQAALAARMATEDVMRLVLAHRVANKIKSPPISPEACYAYFGQNLPPSLPGDLIESTEDWQQIGDLTEQIANALVFMDSNLQKIAFENAIKANLMPITVGLQKDDILKAFAELKQEYALEKPILIGNCCLKNLLEMSNVAERHHSAVASAFLKHKNLDTNFWAALNSKPDDFGGKEAVQRFQSTVELGHITTNFIPLMTRLKDKIGNRDGRNIKSVRDLAKLTNKDWQDLISEQSVLVPEGITGSSDDKVKTYAGMLVKQSEQLFPAVALMARASGFTDVATLLDAHPELDLHRTNLAVFAADLKKREFSLDPEVLKKAQVAQRVLRIAPTTAAGLALIDQNIHNSAQIVAMGKERFAEIMANTSRVDRRTALTVYGLAEQQYAKVLQQIAEYRFELHRNDPCSIIKHTYTLDELKKLLGDDIPNLETLFGTLDFCDCPHCQSVYGPPAYLADVLRYLDNHDSKIDADEQHRSKAGKKTVKDILFERRPDIGNIKLNCENTETPLPYIDLVCEVLENAIPLFIADIEHQDKLGQGIISGDLRAAFAQKGRPLTDNASVNLVQASCWRITDKNETFILNKINNGICVYTTNEGTAFQTKLSAAELRAFPENLRREAYETLRIANYPMNIAFDLWQEEARVFLQHLGVPRWELMEAFQSRPSEGLAFPSNESIAGEYFGISSHEIRLITKPAKTVTEQALYWNLLGETISEITVADFMRRSRLNYEQVLELFYVQWINPFADQNKIIIKRPGNSCNTEEQKLVNITVDRLDRVHRFLRLWRHTDWAMWELDLLIRASASGNNEINLLYLKQFKQVQKRLGLTTEQALSLFAKINTEVRVKPDKPQIEVMPLYVNLFLNPAVIKPVDEKFAIYKESDDHLFTKDLEPITGKELPDTEPLSGHEATLLAAFSLTESDLALLLEPHLVLREEKKALVQDQLNLSNLTLIGRHALLAKGLGIRIKDLLPLMFLSGITDIFASPKRLLDFIELQEWVKRSRFLVDELDYLLNNKADSPHGLRDEVITQHLKSLRNGLRTNMADPSLTENDRKSRQKAFIISHIATIFSLASEQSQLLLEHLDLGIATLERLMNGEDALTIALIAQDPQDKCVTIIPPVLKELYDFYHLMHKAAQLLVRLKITQKERLEWLLTNAPNFSLLDFNKLPVTSKPVESLFPFWLNLYKWLYFEGLCPQPEGFSLSKVFDNSCNAYADSFKASIVGLTQWKAKDLDDVVTSLGIQNDSQDDNSFAHIGTYLRLQKCFKQINRIGVDAASLLAWANRDGEAELFTAQQIRQAAKSKYDYSVWLSKVTPLENALREKKRDALISYLIETSQRGTIKEVKEGGRKGTRPIWQDANDLLKYYLIDVEMSACQLTSRIKQAISSTQMFVQRCLLGLEKNAVEVSRVEMQDDDSDNSWKQWKWMKSYRLWEANRKVFLYPENWIEPELRDNKSPFFKELETELTQNDITYENAETALQHYVQKVHEVAHLDIVGAYYELDDTDPRDDPPPEINVIHVIGRTRSHPAIYYYRKFDLNFGEWTAWEKIDLDIQSDQVVPVVYNRRLHLFWLNFVEKPQKVKKQSLPPMNKNGEINSEPTDTPEPPNQLEIQLAWSTRKNDGWTSKRVSKQKLIHPWQRPLFSYNLKPRYKGRENLLWLDLYITQSQQFNDTRFWDAYRNAHDYVTAKRWDETTRPWHSSSFVFDGQVVDVKMKPKAGWYRVMDDTGMLSDKLALSNSYKYVFDNFGEVGRSINQLANQYEIGPRLPLPDGMHYQNTHLANNKQPFNANCANVLEHGGTRTLLNRAKSPFEIVFSQHRIAFDTSELEQGPFFYQDNVRSFFIKREWLHLMAGNQEMIQAGQYDIFPFYHPYTALFMRELNRSGLDGLLNRRIQISPQDYYPVNKFNVSSYNPGAICRLDKTAQKDIVDFERYGAYSIYNWEIFFHAPLLIAGKLSANQRFEEAMRWFHYIFDPTNVDSPEVPQRYWVMRPFYEQNSEDYRKQRINLLLSEIEQHKEELSAWKNNPFKPHLIARFRPVAYQKAVVMKYIDNLIAWGDQLFRRDTIETINEATTIYVLAYELLGRRPVKVPNVEHRDRSYNELTADGPLGLFGNKPETENYAGQVSWVSRTQIGSETLPQLNFYFGIPNNDQLLGYWDKVEDRLFKIRHCMNIAGVVRQLPLFEPPIDPALLVKAAAAGVDLSSLMAEITASQGPYRFQRMVQKAAELCGEVRSLGDKLLSALEKYDVEGLSLLRSTHEIRLQQAIREIRKQQIQEAKESLAGLEKSRETAEQKKEFYESREFMNAWEITALSLGMISTSMQSSIAIGYALAGGLSLIPRITAGISGWCSSPVATADPIDGKNLAESASYGMSTLTSIMSSIDRMGAHASTIGSYARRQDDWNFQAQQATNEIAQIEKQILANKVRLAIAERELENQELQIEQSQAVDEYMRSKYTNQQLYDWQVRQLSTIYFQSYQLAYDMAKKAEKSFQFEIGDPAVTFIQSGYWDSLKKGLLSGEMLMNDIHRMEVAYLDQNKRDLEITKNISLAQYMPVELMKLKEGGSCEVELPEWLFDMDYPGHYCRRIKSASISIPCVVGPYTSVNCTLSLLNNGIRMSDDMDNSSYGDPLSAESKDERFYTRWVPESSIATSHAQNDAGMFELNFNDERYLPFEGAGAVSRWSIEMPKENNQLDLATISDVILHIRYTAKKSKSAIGNNNLNLETAARHNIDAKLPSNGFRLIVLNSEFSTAWHHFLHPGGGAEQTLSFTLGREQLPFYARGKNKIILTKVTLILESTIDKLFKVALTAPEADEVSATTEKVEKFGDAQYCEFTTTTTTMLGTWQFKIKKTVNNGDAPLKPGDESLKPEDIQNAYLMLEFSTS